MNGNIRVGNLFGIPFYVNPSWFFILGLVTLIYGGQLAQFPQVGGITPWILGLVAAILLFASVLAHELGHSFVAIAQGIEVKSISLFIFGGLASLEKESKTPAGSFYIAIAGPAVSLLLYAFFTALNASIAFPTPADEIIFLLAQINLFLALFNLIPGLPLDGGNILKALVWQITGNPNKGVIFASRVGQFFGWLAVVIGLMGTLGISSVGSLWTAIIGWFLLQNAGFSAQSATIQDKLSNYTAEDAVIANSPIVPANLTLRELANDYIIGKEKWRKFLVTNGEGQLLGTISVEEMKKVPTSQWTETSVKDLTQPAATDTLVKSNISLLEVVKLIEKQEIKEFTVVREDGVVVGLLEKASIINLLQKEAKAKLA